MKKVSPVVILAVFGVISVLAYVYFKSMREKGIANNNAIGCLVMVHKEAVVILKRSPNVTKQEYSLMLQGEVRNKLSSSSIRPPAILIYKNILHEMRREEEKSDMIPIAVSQAAEETLIINSKGEVRFLNKPMSSFGSDYVSVIPQNYGSSD